MTAPVLQLTNARLKFGGVTALDDVGFHVSRGEILSIIGPNGAGKTTLFNVASGIYRATGGSIFLDGNNVTGLTPHELSRRGLSRTFQNLQIFFRMSVVENVMVGCHAGETSGLFADLIGLPSARRQNAISHGKAMSLLEKIGLASIARRTAGDLPYGVLKRLEIARALATNPFVLMLDEPAAGCNAIETTEVGELIREVARDGTAVVLVEHDMTLVMKISDRVLVLNQGRRLIEGTPDAVRLSPEVIAAYLGQHGSQADA